jgi:hypothetical protein
MRVDCFCYFLKLPCYFCYFVNLKAFKKTLKRARSRRAGYTGSLVQACAAAVRGTSCHCQNSKPSAVPLDFLGFTASLLWGRGRQVPKRGVNLIGGDGRQTPSQQPAGVHEKELRKLSAVFGDATDAAQAVSQIPEERPLWKRHCASNRAVRRHLCAHVFV